MKRICCLFFVATLVLSLAGCQGGVDMPTADESSAAFFACVAAGDYEAAKGYLHPSYSQDLESYFTSLEEQHPGLDFQSGLEVETGVGEKGINLSWSWYDSTVGGSQYTRNFWLTVSGMTLYATVKVVENKDGYGIYDLTITPAGE